MSNNNTLLPPEATQAAWEFGDFEPRVGLYGGVFAASFIFFAGSLFLTNWAFNQKEETEKEAQQSTTSSSSSTSKRCTTLIPGYAKEIYSKLNASEQADWCSRVNSTTHAIIVCVGFPWTLAQTSWSAWPYLLALDDMAIRIRCIMAVSAAYFAVDTFVVVYYRVPIWGVFLAHHIAAGIPLFNNVFNSDPTCRRATFDLGMFLLVEFCTFFVNTQSWLETCKLKRYYRKTYIASIYGAFISWIPLRLVLPMFILVHLYKTIVLPENVLTGCMVAPLISAHFIVLFCYVVFFGLFLPQMIKRWRGKERMPEDMLTDEEEQEEEEKRKRKKMRHHQPHEQEDHQSNSEPFLEQGENDNADQKKKTTPHEDSPLIGVEKKTDDDDNDDDQNNNKQDSTKIQITSNPLHDHRGGGSGANNDEPPPLGSGFESGAAAASSSKSQKSPTTPNTASTRRLSRKGSMSESFTDKVTEKIKEVVEETLEEVEEALMTVATSGHL